jgi:uncharacterized membrane protein YedE/YeeE
MRPAAFFTAFTIGALFGTGLLVAGMVDPGTIQGFLDVAGDWQPQLLATLGSAILVTSLLNARARARSRPLVSQAFHWPTRSDVNARLVTGSAVFGAGWALAGYCPGPALAAVGTGSDTATLFVLAMAAGLWIAAKWEATR